MIYPNFLMLIDNRFIKSEICFPDFSDPPILKIWTIFVDVKMLIGGPLNPPLFGQIPD